MLNLNRLNALATEIERRIGKDKPYIVIVPGLNKQGSTCFSTNMTKQEAIESLTAMLQNIESGRIELPDSITQPSQIEE